MHFVFSILWGLGTDLNSHGKAKFSEFLKNMCSNADFIYEHEIYTILTEDYKWTNLGIELSIPLPLSTKSLYDIYYNPIKKQWATWKSNIKTNNRPPTSTKFHSILVPVESSIIYDFFFSKLCSGRYPYDDTWGQW